MKNSRKNENTDLKRFYTLFLEFGLVVALLLFIIAMKVTLKSNENNTDFTKQQEVVKMKKVKQTQQKKKPPPPPTPKVPVQVPNDKVIKDQHININSEIDLDKPLPEPPKHTTKKGNTKEKIFRAVEQQPHPIGGQKALSKKVKYPPRCKNAGIEGRVTLQFVVNTDGSVQDVKVIRGIGGGCDKEAIKVIRNSKWVPGRQRGKPVRVRYTWPITFRLQ